MNTTPSNVQTIGKRRGLVLVRIPFDSPKPVTDADRQRVKRHGGKYELDAAGHAIALTITAKGYLEMSGDYEPDSLKSGEKL